MPPGKLFLIGEVHTDPKKRKRAEVLLSEFSPTVVSIESSGEDFWSTVREYELLMNPDQQDAIRKRLKQLYPHANQKVLKSTITEIRYGLERAIHGYVTKSDATVVFAEDDILVAHHLEEVGAGNGQVEDRLRAILAMSSDGLNQQVEDEYNASPPPIPDKLAALYTLRDAYAEQVIRRQQGLVVHFGGIDHMFGDYHNLADRLRDLNPTCLRLNQVDSLEKISGD